MATKRLFQVLPVLVLGALVLPSASFGQATRTWVSGVGDDVNPCSRTAPCKTFAGAISKTATGGIINVLDDGGFGTLTITKAITVDGGHHTAGMLASGGINGINVNAPATAKVVLRNLDIEGNGTTLGLNGVRILNARSVKLRNVGISSFSRSGVALEPVAGATVKLSVVDSDISDNGGVGVLVAPANTGVGRATVRNSNLDDNGCGIAAASHGMDSGFNFNADCATATSASGVNGTAAIQAYDNLISDNSNSGVLSRGPTAVIRIGGNEIVRNAFGLRAPAAGGSIRSFGNNMVIDNGTDGTTTGAVLPLLRPAH